MNAWGIFTAYLFGTLVYLKLQGLAKDCRASHFLNSYFTYFFVKQDSFTRVLFNTLISQFPKIACRVKESIHHYLPAYTLISEWDFKLSFALKQTQEAAQPNDLILGAVFDNL
jgi:hypothetical protein